MRDAHVERILAAQDRRLSNLYGVRVSIEGSASPDINAVADQLRTMIVATPPEPEVLVIGPKRNRQQRRADAARARR